MQWLVLCGIPYRDQGCDISAASADPTNQLPTSLTGQAPKRPPGGSTAHNSNFFESTTGYPRLQPATDRKCLTCGYLLRLAENTNQPAETQPRQPCEKPIKSVGKAPRAPDPTPASSASDANPEHFNQLPSSRAGDLNHHPHDPFVHVRAIKRLVDPESASIALARLRSRASADLSCAK